MCFTYCKTVAQQWYSKYKWSLAPFNPLLYLLQSRTQKLYQKATGWKCVYRLDSCYLTFLIHLGAIIKYNSIVWLELMFKIMTISFNILSSIDIHFSYIPYWTTSFMKNLIKNSISQDVRHVSRQSTKGRDFLKAWKID